MKYYLVKKKNNVSLYYYNKVFQGQEEKVICIHTKYWCIDGGKHFSFYTVEILLQDEYITFLKIDSRF